MTFHQHSEFPHFPFCVSCSDEHHGSTATQVPRRSTKLPLYSGARRTHGHCQVRTNSWPRCSSVAQSHKSVANTFRIGEGIRCRIDEAPKGAIAFKRWYTKLVYVVRLTQFRLLRAPRIRWLFLPIRHVCTEPDCLDRPHRCYTSCKKLDETLILYS